MKVERPVGAVIRADSAPIEVGAGTNVQDNCVLHTDAGAPLFLGLGDVSVGHSAILHGCTVEDDVLVGLGAKLMNGSRIGAGSLVAAGALAARRGRRSPPEALSSVRRPGSYARCARDEEVEEIKDNARLYGGLAREWQLAASSNRARRPDRSARVRRAPARNTTRWPTLIVGRQGASMATNNGRLEGKVALITGTGSGQGQAAALKFAQEGALVVGCDLNVEGSAETVRLLEAAGLSMTSMPPVDLGDPVQAKKWVDDAAAVHGRVDVLYNNAAGPRFGPLPDLSVEDWDFGIRNELSLVFYATKFAWPYLAERGGVVINTGLDLRLHLHPRNGLRGALRGQGRRGRTHQGDR